MIYLVLKCVDPFTYSESQAMVYEYPGDSTACGTTQRAHHPKPVHVCTKVYKSPDIVQYVVQVGSFSQAVEEKQPTYGSDIRLYIIGLTIL
jgi:hypothetical protein